LVPELQQNPSLLFSCYSNFFLRTFQILFTKPV
jgi:hypothetical protein